MSENDYYKILGLNRDASDDEIKKSYRKLALKTHPDKNNGDDIEFKKINEAYETLSDSNKKHIYDNPQNAFQGFGNGGDIFEHLMRHMNVNQPGQNTRRQKKTHIHKINISLRDVHCGIKKTLKITILKQCFTCKSKCTNCNGNGTIVKIQQLGPFMQQLQMMCNVCNGSGTCMIGKGCIKCNNGIISEQQTLNVDIKMNIKTGDTILYKELGEQATKCDDIPGDLIIEINVESDPYFERNGDNLVYNSKITLAESIIGKEIIVPHFDEYFKMNINTFGIINPKKLYTIKNKGLGNKGNLDFIFEIIYPDKMLDNSEIDSLSVIFKNIKILE